MERHFATHAVLEYRDSAILQKTISLPSRWKWGGAYAVSILANNEIGEMNNGGLFFAAAKTGIGFNAYARCASGAAWNTGSSVPVEIIVEAYG